MTRSDIALLLSPLPLSPLLLALAACGGELERAGRSGTTQASPFGFEMASAAFLGGPLSALEGRTLGGAEAEQPIDKS